MGETRVKGRQKAKKVLLLKFRPERFCAGGRRVSEPSQPSRAAMPRCPRFVRE